MSNLQNVVKNYVISTLKSCLFHCNFVADVYKFNCAKVYYSESSNCYSPCTVSRCVI